MRIDRNKGNKSTDRKAEAIYAHDETLVIRAYKRTQISYIDYNRRREKLTFRP